MMNKTFTLPTSVLKNQIITFSAPNSVEILLEDLHPESLGPHELLIESLYSLISAGTELACLSGEEFWFPLPGVPGYCNIGRVIAVGEGVSKFSVGDVLLNYGKHQKYNRLSDDQFLLQPPDWMDLKLVPLTRLATVAFTALRVSDIELGDDVAVVGLGLVGNLAAQLAQLQGARVIGIGHRERRIDLARQCGIEYSINARREDVGSYIHEATGGAGLLSLIDTSGNPQAIGDSLAWLCPRGELILLAESRGDDQANPADVYNRVFMANSGPATIKGAHEWQYPTLHDPLVKHSFERNSRIVWRLYQAGQLKLDGLISHVVQPQAAPAAYEALRTKQPDYQGVLFDWTAEPSS
ncbi:zinc-binding alcohol dehydrogenase [Chloroflexi bacterium TSY]|nr:zinc-binding alcohol dehydrogenase [Chloroflexi bacterium TSY]